MKPVSPQHTRALLMLLLANLFWGLSFPVIKAILFLHGQLVPEAGSWFSTLYTVAPRFLLAGIVLLAWRWRDIVTMTRRELRQGVTLGLFAAGGMLLQNDGLHYTEASTSAFLTQLSAILIPIWIALRTGRNPGGLVWLCCGLVLTGVAILGRFDFDRWQFGRGEWETLLSAFFFMGQILTLDRRADQANRAMPVTWVMFVTEAAVYWPLVFLVSPQVSAIVVPWTSPAWIAFTLTLTVFCTLGSFTLMNMWQPRITATEAGLIYCIEPIFASVMALFLPGWFSAWAVISYANETATWTLLAGGALITIANVLLQMRPPVRSVDSGTVDNGQ
jgi:drug/metabolite transporter (DMT)-like permease